MTLAMIHEILADHNLTSTQKLMLVALALHAEPDGTGAYPGYRRLETLTSLSSGWIRPILNQLEAAGYLTIAPRASPVGSNLYTLHLHTASLDKAYTRPGTAPVRKADPQTRDLKSQDLPHGVRHEPEVPDPVLQQPIRQPLSPEAEQWLAQAGLNPDGPVYQLLAGMEDRLSTLEGKALHRPSPPARPPHLYDTSTTYLGKLCTRAHDYEDTGQSLRHKTSGNCVQCKTLDQKARRQVRRS